MPSKFLIKALFYLSVVLFLISFFSITWVEKQSLCLSSECFDLFLSTYKFPLWLLGGSLALWTLELSTRRLEQMNKSLVLDNHYRRMEYFCKALQHEIESKKSLKKPKINYHKFYFWLYPQSVLGIYEISDSFEKMGTEAFLLSEKLVALLKEYKNSKWPPYIGDIPKFFDGYNLAPAGSGLESSVRIPSNRMLEFNDESNIVRVAMQKVEEIEALVNAVFEVHELPETKNLYHLSNSLKENRDRRLRAWNEVNEIRNYLHNILDICRDSIEEATEHNEKILADEARIAINVAHICGDKPAGVELSEYMKVFVLTQLALSYQNRDIDFEEVSHLVSEDLHKKYLYVKNKECDPEFLSWAQSLDLKVS